MRRILLVIFSLAFASGAQAQNYTATPGSGLTFGAKLGSGSVLFPYFIGCDATTPTQCWTVNSSGQLSVTVASGAVASGAMSAGSYAAGALVAGALVDGADITEGTKADSAYAGSGSASVISLLKGLYVVAGNPLAAGTNGIGTVDPTTPANWGLGSTGSAPPAKGVYQGANVGGNLTGSIKCGSSVVYDASTSGPTQLVALSGSTSVYVCGYTIVAGGTVNVNLSTGTGTACATGTAKITPAYQLTAQAGVADGTNEYRGLKGAASSELCINTSAAVAVQAIVYFTQF